MKFKYFLFMIMVSLVGTFGVNAATLKIEGDSSIKNGAPTTYALKLDAVGENITKVEFGITAVADIDFVAGYDPENVLQKINPSATSVIMSTNKIFTDQSTIGTIKVTYNGLTATSFNLTLTNVAFTKEDGTTINVPSISKDGIKLTAAAHTSAKLSNLTISSGTIAPTFTSNTYDYKVNIDNDLVSKVTLKPTCEESGCTFEVLCKTGCTPDESTPNKIALIQGKNEVTFKVTSQDTKNSEEYNFIIYRGKTADGSNLLSSLGIEGFELKEKFNKDNLDYTATVDYETEEIKVNAVAEDTNADVQIKGDSKLQVGDNVVTITVTSAETGDKKIYNITVTREDFKPTSSTTKAVIVDTDKESGTKVWLIVVLAIVGLGIIGVSAYFIFFRKKKDKNNKNKKGLITADEEIKIAEDAKLLNLDIKTNELEDTVNVTGGTSVDEALADLMETKEISIPNELLK